MKKIFWFIIPAAILILLVNVAPVKASDWSNFWNGWGNQDSNCDNSNPDNVCGQTGQSGVWKLMQQGGLNDVGNRVYGETGTPDLRASVFLIVQALLGFLGIIFLILVIYAGFTWMTAGGNEEKIGTAKKLLTNAAIGLAIILCAYAITLFIFNVLIKATIK